MKKATKLALLVCLAILACALLFTACDGGEEAQTPSGTTNLHVHNFGEWTVTAAPSCDKAGIQTRTCACGEEEEQSVAPQHKMVAEVHEVEPSCTAAGQKTTGKCSLCGHKTIDYFGKPLGHTLSAETPEGHLRCDTCGVSSKELNLDLFYSWHKFYQSYGSYETWENNMGQDIFLCRCYDVIVPRYNYITSILPTLCKDSKLEAITMTENVLSIGESAFENCTKLKYVFLTASVTKIESRAFANCENLLFVQFNGTKAQWNAIEKGPDWDDGTGNYTVYCTDGEITK